MARAYTNFAKSTLASGIGSGATSLTVAAGQGALFPSTGGGATFDCVIFNTSAQREVISVTTRATDVFTIVRAQEGTTALTWNASDGIGHRLTAAALNNIMFADDLQENTPMWCGTAGGSANGLTLTPTPAITAYVTGQKFIFKASSSANTTPVTVAVSGLATKAVENNGVALVAGDIEASKWYEILYDGVAFQAKKYQIATWVNVLASTTAAAVRSSLAIAGKQAIAIPASALTPRSANGCAFLVTSSGAANQPDVPYLAFDGAAKEYAGFSMEMPKGWNEGTVTIKFSWRRASGTGAADVVWGIRAAAISDDESPAITFGSDATVTDAASTTLANMNLSAETGACTIAGTPAENDLVFFEVFRDGAAGADTLNAVDAWLTSVTLFITTNETNDA